jgi:hypothetical protein
VKTETQRSVLAMMMIASTNCHRGVRFPFSIDCRVPPTTPDMPIWYCRLPPPLIIF